MTQFVFDQLVQRKKAELVRYLYDHGMMRGGSDWARYKQEQAAQRHTPPQMKRT